MERGETRSYPRLLPPFGVSLGGPGRWLVIVPLVLLGVLLLAGAAFSWRYSSRVHPGVEVLGADLSGKTLPEAEATIRERANSDLARNIQFQFNDFETQVEAGKMGLRLDAAETAQRAFAVGRTGSLIDQWSGRLRGLRSNQPIAPAVSLDQQAAAHAVEGLASEIDRPVRDASISLSADALHLQTSQIGYRVDVPATVQRLPASLDKLYQQNAPIELVVQQTQPQVTEAHLKNTYDQLALARSQPVTLSFQDRQWELSPETMRPMLRLRGEGAGVKPALDPAALDDWIRSEMATDIDQPVRNARVRVRTGDVSLVPGQDRHQLDIAAAATQLQTEAFAPSRKLTAPVKVTLPNITDAELQAAVAQADAMVNRPLRLSIGEQTWELSKADLTGLLRWKGKGEDRTPYLAPKGLRNWVAKIADEVYKAPKNARIEMRAHGLVVVPDQRGLSVSEGKTLRALQEHVADPRGVVPLVTTKPAADVRAGQLQAAAAQANTLTGQPVTLTLNGESWTAEVETLRSWLRWEGVGVNVKPYLDRAEIQGFVQDISSDVYVEAQDAYLTSEGGTFELVEEVEGLQVLEEATVDTFQRLTTLKSGRSGAVQTTTTSPDVTAEDLQHAYGEGTSYAGTRFYLTLGEQTWWLDPEDLVKTLYWTGEGADTHTWIDEGALREQIEYWVAADEDSNIIINYEATAADAAEAIYNGSRTVDITYKRKTVPPVSAGHKGNEAYWNGNFPDKWIDINLSTQSMAAYEGRKQVRTTLVTTGRPELPTPTGTFYVMAKLTPYEFISPWPKESEFYYDPIMVSYALRFTSAGHYIHDAPYREVYGPGSNGSATDSYTGSHGCVNVPGDAMAWIFAWAEEGTPIVIHE